MEQDEIIEMAESCGFTRTHTGEVHLWLCNKNDLATFMHKVAEDAYHRGIQNGVVAGANNEREACLKIQDECQYSYGNDLAKAIRARGEAK